MTFEAKSTLALHTVRFQLSLCLRLPLHNFLSGADQTELPFAEHIKKHVKNTLIGTVGIITEPKQANDIIEQGRADVVMCARQVLRNVDFPLDCALELGAAVAPAVQYERYVVSPFPRSPCRNQLFGCRDTS